MSLYKLKELTRCRGDSDPFYSDEKESLYLIFIAFGKTPSIEVNIGIRTKSSDLTRTKRTSYLENVMFREFSLRTNESAQYEFKIDSYDHPLRLTATSDAESEANVYFSFCQSKHGDLVLSLKPEKYEVVFVNTSYLAKIIDETKCDNDQDALLEVSRRLFVNVIGASENSSSGTVELGVDLEEGFESNSTDPAPKPHLISTQKIELNQSSIHEFNITLEDLDAGLNLTITVQKGEISMDMKQCENATAVNVNKFTHGYHYVHFNNSFIIDVISKTKCEPSRNKRDILYYNLNEPQNLNILVQGLADHNLARLDIYNGFGNSSIPEETSQEHNKELSCFQRYSTWIIFTVSFVAFLVLAIAAMVYANYHAKQKHWNRRREAMKFLRSASEPGVVHPIRESERINVFEMSGRNWM